MAPNSLGLLGLFLGLVLAYGVAVRLLALLAGVRLPPARLLALFALPLVPIACGYHFAHYLPVFLVDVQYAIRAASDPIGRGWDLLGMRDLPVVTSFLSDPERVYAIWHSQVAIIVAAHVAGVIVAHALALRLADRTPAAVSQLPMLVLMIGYTTLGLWLLSTPGRGLRRTGRAASRGASGGAPVESPAGPCYKGPASRPKPERGGRQTSQEDQP